MQHAFSRRAFLQLLGNSALIATLPWPLRSAFGQSTSTYYETFAKIEEALGYSIFYDEYKGNFSTAKRVAQKTVVSAQSSGNPAKLADALIALTKVHLLKGEATTALSTLSQAEPLVTNDPIRQYRFFTFSYAAKVLQQNTFPKGNGYLNPAKGGELLIDYLEKIKSLKDIVKEPNVLFENELIKERFEGFPQFLAMTMQNRDLKLADHNNAFNEFIKYKIEFRGQVAISIQNAHHLPPIDLYLTDCYRNLDITAAQENLTQIKTRYQQSNDSAGFASCLLLEGDWAAAPFSMPPIHNVYIGSTSGSANGNPHWAIEEKEFDFNKADLAKAKQLYQKAQNLFAQASARRGLAAVALRYSYLAAVSGDYAEAKQKSLEAQKIFSEQGDELGFTTSIAHSLLARIGNGELIGENNSEISQIALWGTTSGSLSYALGLGIMIGRVARRWLLKDGDYERALAGYRLAESLYEALGNTIYQAKAAVDQGNLLLDLGENTEAATLFDKAIRFHRIAGEKDYEGETWMQRKVAFQYLLLNSLFNIHLDRNDPDAMELVVKQIGELFGQFSSQDTQHAATHPLALGSANDSFEFSFMVPALRVKKAYQRGDKLEMQKQLEIALALAHRGSPEQRDYNEGVVYAYAYDFDRAKQALKRYFARPSDTGIGSHILNQMLSNPDLERAAKLELQIQRRRFHQQAYMAFNNLRAYEDAYSHLQALELLSGKDWWQTEDKPWEELEYYGSIYQGLGRLEEAIRYYDQAITLLETRRQRISRDQYKTALANSLSSRAIYFGAASTTLKLAGDEASPDQRSQILLAKAYHYAERGKARGLLDLMSSRTGTALLDSKANSAVRAWHELNAKLTTWHGLLGEEQRQQSPSVERITYLNQRIAEDEASLNQAEQSLAQANPNFYQTINPQAQVLNAEAIANRLPENSLLIQYYYGSEDLLIWGITHNGQVFAHRKSIDENRLNRQIESFHRACEQRTAIDSLGNELSALLLAPLKDLIETSARLIIVPVSKMHVLPFQSLPFNGQPLVANHAISYLPSASTLQFIQIDRSVTSNNRVLAIGNPANMAYKARFAKQSIPQPSLTGAGKEASYIAKLFPQGRALIGSQATKEAVRDALNEYPIVHFATHGILSDESPLLSSILLANGEALTVYELMGSQLNADLVVLSACRTAQGEVTRGDDVLGLTRGLLSAGAKSAVTTLWPVDDIATSILMEQFYQYVRNGASPASALQNAQNDLRTLSTEDIQLRQESINRSVRGLGLPGTNTTPTEKNYAHPYYWAAFMLVG
ncbi:MAG: CHAT domain-containing protein [Nitrosomonas sp.]|uniref:CHAT domain-containing protein n=1 Tax=Nitrosomonas sp. TaxID=42353 RepID=UPI0032EBEADE